MKLQKDKQTADTQHQADSETWHQADSWDLTSSIHSADVTGNNTPLQVGCYVQVMYVWLHLHQELETETFKQYGFDFSQNEKLSVGPFFPFI